jgi:hypothetical protein
MFLLPRVAERHTRRRELLSRFIFHRRTLAAHGMKTSLGPQPKVAATTQIKLQHCSKERLRSTEASLPLNISRSCKETIADAQRHFKKCRISISGFPVENVTFLLERVEKNVQIILFVRECLGG